MAAKVVKLAQPASPTINQVFEEFLAEQCVLGVFFVEFGEDSVCTLSEVTILIRDLAASPSWRLLDPGPNIFRPIA
jgi:hypothetical protein